MKKDSKDVFGSAATEREKKEMGDRFGASRTPRERADMEKKVERRAMRKAKR
jgi:hypothetical protein